MTNKKPFTILAGAAHPDDIEFMMAGTLLLLRNAGAEIHIFVIASGSCGTVEYSKKEIVRLRRAEAESAALMAGAVFHPPLADDLEIMFEPDLLRRVAAVIRDVRPDLLLAPSPEDYMEDHQNACRLLVTGAFARGMPNFRTDPEKEPWDGPIAIYHALPHGLRDPLRRKVRPGQFVDIGSVLAEKRSMLAAHRTQKEWLDRSQGIDAYLNLMETFAREAGEMSGRFEYSEGWRRRLHWGYGPENYDPLSEMLGSLCWIDPEYE
ncbi:MAG: PIG-L deacetylase family protein [Candidatus Latescibacterota bacterium]